MSRDGSEGRIDSLKSALNTEHYHRTALGSAVRYNAMLNLIVDLADGDPNANEFSGRFSDLITGDRRVTREEFVTALHDSIQNVTDDYSDQIRSEFQDLRSRGELPVDLTEDQVNSLFNGTLEDEDLINALEEDTTVQEAISRRGYRTALGQSIANATTEQRSMFFDHNSPFNTGATGAFRSFTNGFVQGDKDFFGSRVLYDNVFGMYEDGGESLTMLHRRSISDPTNDMNRTAGAKIMDDVVNRSIYDQTEIIDRVDTEFSRFHGESMIDQLSMTGSGLQAARQTVRRVLAEGSALGRQLADRGEADHPIDFANAMITRLNENITNDIGELNNALSLLDNNLKNRSGQSVGVDGGYVNKAGVAQFIDMINTAGTRTETGEIIGGHISISSFQFQNETISAALGDKIERQVLESVLQRRQGATGGALQVDLVLAYPRQRNLNDRNSEDTRFGVGSTNYAILGPNLIEAMKLEEVKNNVYDMLRGMGIADAELETYLKVNIQFRDKKFHPKVYLTDNVAGIGTQNLTGPVGNSVNQAGSNFETMRFVANKYRDDEQLRMARSEYTADGRDRDRETIDNTSKTEDIAQSLLYRQISAAVDYEHNYDPTGKLARAGGGTSTPILNNRRGHQIGFAGDIYEHMRNTLDYAYATNFNIVDGSQKGNIRKEVAGQNTTHMFMVLDQAFMLQLGSGATQKLLKGEMGEEIGTPFADRGDTHRQYRAQQNKLFDLLAANKANVVVDAKNYREQVINPLKEKIQKSNDVRLQENFKRAGQSLGLLAGYELFDPGSASTPDEYNAAMKSMRRQLKRQGFTEENGFTEADIKQLIGLASGNIEMAKAPRQHVKSFGLMDYTQGGSPELISYYMGSSNLGLYSLGIPTGDNGGYRGTDGDLTNTEMGMMLGRRDIDAQLSRATAHKARMVGEGNPTDINGIMPPIIHGEEDWSLNQEEERHELRLAQRHLIHTWKQLGNSQMDNPNFKAVNTAPLWQSNVNHGDLEILKDRLETMAREFGIDPAASRSAFQIVERYGATSGSGVTSINVTLDIAQMLGTSGYMKASASMPKLNFELTVLQGPSRGAGMLQDRTEDGSVPGFVYFVDKNKVVGNGIFSNDSGRDIQVLGRRDYDDDFIGSMKGGGRITLKSGESAHMSSLDVVPQMFATLIGEGISRFGTTQAHDKFKSITNPTQALEEYVATALTGRGSQLDEREGYLNQLSSGRKGDSYVKTAREQIKSNLTNVSMHAMLEAIERDAFSLERAADADFNEGRNPAADRTRRQNLRKNLNQFKQFVQQTVNQDVLDSGEVSDTTVNNILNMVKMLAYESPQMANIVMKAGGLEDDEAAKIRKFKDFQSLMFGSFLQSRDDRTYGGQQGFYRTILMGVGDSTVDSNTAGLMYDPDDTPGLHNVAGYARFKPLEYTPTTDIHEVLYRSVASKSTSMTKNDGDLDSLLLESEARDLGDAANLRLMSSIGVGTILNRDDYAIKDDQGNILVGNDQREIFEAMEAAGVEQSALERARNAYIAAVQDSSKGGFSFDSDSRRDRTRLQFYTGPTGKLSQLPQRIKNAMGARPLYQYSVEARLALDEGTSIQDITKSYLQRNRDPLKRVTSKEVDRLEDERERLVATLGDSHPDVQALDRRINNLIRIGSNAFNNSVAGLGAVFSGRIKSVLNAEQAAYIQKVRSLLFESLEDVLAAGDLSEEQFDELLRVEVMKAGLVNKGLGKMIAGSDNMKYSMSIIQLSGTYNDTFLANPLYGTTYGSKADYQAITKNQLDVETMTPDELKAAGVLNVGMREGYLETQQKSIKASMMGEGGMDVLLQAGDKIVEDKQTGMFVHRRKVNGVWTTVNIVDDKRNLATIGNVIDNTSFSNVGSPTLGTQPTTTYGRRGEASVDYIYEVEARPGNFTNNEYLIDFKRLRSIQASSGRRVEGTDSASLVKGVAFFAGRTKYETASGEESFRNPFEDIERQLQKSYEQGEVGGSLAALLDYAEETQEFETQAGRKVYTPLSSMIQGVFNSNNFKSFFWSHGATILRAQSEGKVGTKGDHFMVNKLFDSHQDVNVQNAKKLAGALMLSFGTDFISSNQGDQAQLQGKRGQLKQTLVSAMMAGEYGAYHQQLALATAMNLKAGDTDSIQKAIDTRGLTRAQATSELLFDKISKKAGYNEMRVGAIGAVTSELLGSVFAGDSDASTRLLDMVRKGIIDPVAKRASQVGGINFDNSADQQAALLVTAVDFMHQLSRKGSQLTMPSDIDMGSSKMQEVLLTAVGMGGFEDDDFKDDILDIISGLNTQINAVSVFTDITFSFSKDPTGTQTIGKHEAHHLITPYLGNIKKYQEGGQLDKIQHTVAALAAITQGVRSGKTGLSGLAYYDRLAKSGFTEKTALNLADAETDYLFSSFHKEKFLGFYQQGTVGIAAKDYVTEYKNINKDLARGSYQWGEFQTIRNMNDPSQINHFTQGGNRVSDLSVMGDAQKQVDRFIDKFYPGIEPNERQRLQDKFLAMGGQEFALFQLDALTSGMATMNARFQADPRKSIGKDTTGQFLQRMQNKQMFITIPNIDFQQQNGEIVARTDRQKEISTILPSADDMRVMGAQYADFVDPILSHYKNISSIFVPGTQENEVFEKIRLATQSGVPIVLSTTEFAVYKRIQDSAQAMPTELQKGIAGARFQEAMAGKNKYQGFTSTGIGSMLMPFGMAALAQTKLDEAGLRENKARIEAIKESDRKVRQLREKLQASYTDKERAYIDMDLLDKGKSVQAEMLRIKGAASSFNEKQKTAYSRLDHSLKQMQKHRKQGFAAEREGLSGSAKAQNMAALLDHMDSAYDQLDVLYNSELENESVKQSIAKLRQDVDDHRLGLQRKAETLFGLRSYSATDVMHVVGGDKALYDAKDERYEIVQGKKAARLSVYGVAQRGKTEIRSVGMIVGDDAIPLIGLSTDPKHPVNARKGYIYTDEETGEDEVIQRASFRAAYIANKTTLPEYPTEAANKATARPDFKMPTNQLTLAEATSKIADEQDRIIAEINEKYGFTDTASNTQRTAFDSGEVFGPPLPPPTFKDSRVDPLDPRADITRDSRRPAAWETRGAERQEFIRQTRAAVLRSDEQQLGTLADSIEGRLDTMRPDMRGAMERILDEDIPNAFDRISNDLWLSTNGEHYPQGFFTPEEIDEPQKLLPGIPEDSEDIGIERLQKLIDRASTYEDITSVRQLIIDIDTGDVRNVQDDVFSRIEDFQSQINTKQLDIYKAKGSYIEGVSELRSNLQRALSSDESDVFSYLKNIANSLGIKVEAGKTSDKRFLGTYNPIGHKITLADKIPTGYDKTQILGHELFHAMTYIFGVVDGGTEEVEAYLKRTNQVGDANERVAHNFDRVLKRLGKEDSSKAKNWIKTVFESVAQNDFEKYKAVTSEQGYKFSDDPKYILPASRLNVLPMIQDSSQEPFDFQRRLQQGRNLYESFADMSLGYFEYDRFLEMRTLGGFAESHMYSFQDLGRELYEVSELKPDAGIKAYTSHTEVFKKINQAVSYPHNVTDNDRRLSENLDMHLRNLPEYEGVTYRGIDVAYSADSVKVGEDWIENKFLSSSLSELEAGTFARGGTLFEIEGKSGRDVQQWATHATEQEVLFRPGTQFEVIGVQDVSKDDSVPYNTRIKLREKARSTYNVEPQILAAISDFEAKARQAYGDTIVDHVLHHSGTITKAVEMDRARLGSFQEYRLYNQFSDFGVKGENYYARFDTIDSKFNQRRIQAGLGEQPRIAFDSGEMYGPELPRSVIVDYLGGSYGPINRVLRGQVVDEYISDPEELRLYTEETQDLANKLRGEVDALPKFGGTTYRGMSYDPNLKVGEVYSDKAFMSTSENYSTAESFSGRGYPIQQKTIFTVEGRTGRDVSGVPGVISTEREILYRPETPFEIVGSSFDEETGIKHYTLRELDPDTKPSAPEPVEPRKRSRDKLTFNPELSFNAGSDMLTYKTTIGGQVISMTVSNIKEGDKLTAYVDYKVGGSHDQTTALSRKDKIAAARWLKGAFSHYEETYRPDKAIADIYGQDGAGDKRRKDYEKQGFTPIGIQVGDKTLYISVEKEYDWNAIDIARAAALGSDTQQLGNLADTIEDRISPTIEDQPPERISLFEGAEVDLDGDKFVYEDGQWTWKRDLILDSGDPGLDSKLFQLKGIKDSLQKQLQNPNISSSKRSSLTKQIERQDMLIQRAESRLEAIDKAFQSTYSALPEDQRRPKTEQESLIEFRNKIERELGEDITDSRRHTLSKELEQLNAKIERLTIEEQRTSINTDGTTRNHRIETVEPRTQFGGAGGSEPPRNLPPTMTSPQPEEPSGNKDNTEPAPRKIDRDHNRKRAESPSSAREVINNVYGERFAPSAEAVAERADPLYDNVTEFYRKQRAAIAFGISSGLQEQYEGMKRDSLEAKREIAKYNKAEFTTVDEKRAAFNELKANLKQKRDAAYRMAGMDPETGRSIYDQKSGARGGKSSIDGYPVNRPTLQDSYIYHAQALNYEGMLTYVMQVGNEPELEPLSADRVKEMERRRATLAGVEYLLNTTDGADGRNVFEGIGNLNVKFDVNALFMVEQIDPEAGFVESHMKNINMITKEARKVGGRKQANTMSGKYAIEQIEAQIKMYQTRAEEMQKFSREREAVQINADTGRYDEEAMARIETATKDYSENTQKIMDFLEAKKRAIQNGMANGTIDDNMVRHTFEDIDVEVAITESRFVAMSEVFRSPPPGNTDPRMMTYRAMQGIQALNQLTTLVQETGKASSDLRERGTKMIYSTERGQTATVMAALGIVTYGGGDWDGDSYTAIFDQANEIKTEVQKQQGKVTQAEMMVKTYQAQIETIDKGLASIDTSKKGGAKRYEELLNQKARLEKSIETRRKAATYHDGKLTEAVQTMEEKIQVGYKGMTARARAQISAYTGIDERYFVEEGEIMYDREGKVIQDDAGNAVTGLRRGKTMDADAMFVYMEQGYGLIEGVDSKRNQWLTMMNNIDILTGYRNNPQAFDDDSFLRQIVSGVQRDPNGRVSAQSPGIGMIQDRANQLLTATGNLTQEQVAFLGTLRDGGDEAARGMLEQFTEFVNQMDTNEAAQRQAGRLESDAAKLAQQRRAHMNQFIGGKLIAGMQSNEVLGKFMQQGMGMTLTEGTFDMTLKALGKAGGEILGKTYNTIVGSTYQDAPILTVGRELQKEDSDLRKSLQAEFIKQQHARRATEPPSDLEIDLRNEAIQQGLSGADADAFVRGRLDSKYAADFETDFLGTVNRAVDASEDVQGFMKNIHQLLRDSIKLKGDADALIPKLQAGSEKYEEYSQKMSATDDEDERKELLKERNKIVEGMSSQLGPGAGLKALIDLDYLTNESDRGGLTKSEFEERFFTGTIEDNRDSLERMAASMVESGALDAADMHELRGIGAGHTDESAALMKMARAQTTRNLTSLVTSFRMERVEAGGNRGQSIREFAASHRARLATQIEAHQVRDIPSNVTMDANIRTPQEYEAGQRVMDKYTGVIEKEHEGARFDAHRQQKEALASHLEMETSHIYNDDGTLSVEYQKKLEARAKGLGITVEEYTLMFDMQYQETVENVNKPFGVDGQKMENFSVMNMMRKDLSRSMMDGRSPNADKQDVINQSIGSEAMTTLAQLAAAGKLDAEGMDMFTAMNKGVMRHLVEATNREVTYLDKKTGQHVTVPFSELNKQGQNAVITKIVHQNMFGTPDDGSPMGYHRSTNEDAKSMRQNLGAMVGASELELREDGTFGNDIIDALDKTTTGSSTKAQIEMYEAMGEEYLRETLDSEAMQEQLYKQYLKADGVDPNSEKAKTYRKHMTATVKHQMKARQQKMAEAYGYSRSRHSRGYGVQNRSSFMNNLNSKVVGQLAKDSRANALDLVAPLILTAAGTAISEGNISGDQVMALGGAAFTAFQYARTGAIDFSDMDPVQAKARMAAVQASSGIFKLKNAMVNNDGDFGKAIAQTVIQETASVAFNAVAAPWLSRNIAERALGAGATPAMNALDMTRYKAGQQLAGNIGASIISAVSSTVISGVIMNTMQDNKPALSETIRSFMPAAQAVSQVNEAIARRRQQEAAIEDFQAETDGTDDTIQEYQVLTDATYDPDDFASIADLAAAQEIEPGSDGSLSVGIIG